MLEIQKKCPICGKDNNCKHDETCWCMEVHIPQELIERIPLEKRGQACICRNCVKDFKNKDKKPE